MKRAIMLIITILVIGLIRADIEIISETADELIFDFYLNNYRLEESDDYIFLQADGIGYTDERGMPMLPEISYYIAIPSDGRINVQVLETKFKDYSLSKPLLPVPRVIGGDQGSEFIYELDESLYQIRSQEYFSIGAKTGYRYNEVYPLIIKPTKYDYQSSQITVIEKMRLRVSIKGNTGLRNEVVDDLDLKDNILNYETARYWQERNRAEIEYAPFYDSDFWYSFEISEEGVYQLTYQDLSQLPLGDLDPRNIRIFTTGGALLPDTVNDDGFPFEEIPLLVIGEENGVFNQTDSIIFYARNRDGFDQNQGLSGTTRHWYNPYSARGVYWLTFGGRFSEPPLRMETVDRSNAAIVRDSAPAYYHFESENVRRDHEGFTWFTSLLSGFSDSNHNYPFTLNDIDLNRPQVLSIALQADSSSPSGQAHRISVRVNDNLVMDRQQWLGVTYRSFSATGNFLQNGQNNTTLTVHRTGSSSIYFDYYGIEYFKMLNFSGNSLQFKINSDDYNTDVDYRINGNINNTRAYEIIDTHTTNLLRTQELPLPQENRFRIIGRGGEGTRYALVRDGGYRSVSHFKAVNPVDLTTLNSPVEAVIVTPTLYRDLAERLANLYRQEAQQQVLVVDQQDIFNQFNSGMPDPNAVRLFIRHLFYNQPANSQTSLKNITLFGSGTIDWRNFSGQAAEKNKVIIFQRGNNTSEDFFVDQSGNNLPDLGIGRITAQNLNQMGTVIDKIERYWINPTPGIWRNTLLFVADDEHTSSSSNESIHSIQVQSASNLMHPAVVSDKIFGFEYPFDSFGDKPQARNAIISAVNEGRLIWYYIGHGAYDLLGHESYFRTADIQLLHNRDKLPLFIAASCDVAKYDYFAFSSMSERLLWHPDGGSIASLAATRLTSPGPNASLMEEFLIRIINRYQEPGISLMQAKQLFSNQTHNNRRYSYLGDPLLPINTPIRHDSITIKDDPDTLFAYQRVDLTGQYPSPTINGVNSVGAYASERDFSYTVQSNQYVINYTKWGNLYHRGQSRVENGDFEASFVVPGDISTGDRGRILSYLYDETDRKDYVSFFTPVHLSNVAYAEAETDTIPPSITVWLDTENFRNGDTVTANPILYARISDESGINILGELGHKILLIQDEQSTPLDVTDGFVYDLNSHTTGTLTWLLKDLSEGEHNIQLVVFDNHNNPAIARVNFVVKKTDKIFIDRMLPYPNPIKDNGHFTFQLSDDAGITISIYTITGRRIRTIRHFGIRGYNQIFWDGRDQDGSRIANNTYIYKIRAVQQETGQSVEELGKVMILR